MARWPPRPAGRPTILANPAALLGSIPGSTRPGQVDPGIDPARTDESRDPSQGADGKRSSASGTNGAYYAIRLAAVRGHTPIAVETSGDYDALDRLGGRREAVRGGAAKKIRAFRGYRL